MIWTLHESERSAGYGVFILGVRAVHCCYPDSMISYKRSNLLQPEKESVVQINLMPLLVFALGFVLTRTLLNSVKTELK